MTHVDVDIYAEQGVLASIFNTPDAVKDVVELINEHDFREPRHQKIFEVVTEAFRDGQTVSVIAVAAKLRSSGILPEIGGIEYLHQLSDPSAPYALDGDAVTYAEIVKDESSRRAIYGIGRDLAKTSALDSGYTVEEVMSQAQSSIQELGQRLVVSKHSASVADMMEEALVRIAERAEKPSGLQGVPSGLPDLDEYTTGFKSGNFVVVAARPAVGKSTLAVDFARAASIKAGLTSMIFSLEMSQDEIMDRILAAESNVLLNSIRSGRMEPSDWDRINEAKDRILAANLIIDDSPNITLDHIRLSAIRQAATPEGLHLIIVDYLQLLSSGKRTESRQQEVAEFSRSLKHLGRELEVPVIGLSQLNRGVENKSGGENRRPKMSDLRESGAIEQDADIVILLHRPDNENTPGAEMVELIIAKNRNGPSDKILPLAPLLHYSKFAMGTGQFPPPVEDEMRQADPAAYPEEGAHNTSGMLPPPPQEYSGESDSNEAPPPVW